MGKRNGEVLYYTTGKAYITIPFPEDEIICRNCAYLYTDRLDRPRCRFTDRIIFDPYAGTDEKCPIEEFDEVHYNKREEHQNEE